MIHINTTPLAFYESRDLQSHRLSYAYDNTYTLLSGNAKLLPFQVVVAKDFGAVTGIYLYDKSDTQVRNLTSHFNSSRFPKLVFADYDVLCYLAAEAIPMPVLPEGFYYFEIRTATSSVFSELFNVVQTVQASEIVGLTFWDNADFIFQHTPGRIVYSNNYRNKLYLPSKLAKPEYTLEEVVEERDGFKFVEKQIQKKLFRFSFLATEYLCDTLSLIGMHDNIIITYNNRIYPVYDILFTPEWTDEGFVANVDAEFTTDAIVKKIGRLFPRHNMGDFNNDFNSDFNVI